MAAMAAILNLLSSNNIWTLALIDLKFTECIELIKEKKPIENGCGNFSNMAAMTAILNWFQFNNRRTLASINLKFIGWIGTMEKKNPIENVCRNFSNMTTMAAIFNLENACTDQLEIHRADWDHKGDEVYSKWVS